MTLRGMFRPGMRAYFLPLVAGVLLVFSAFLPWVIVGDTVLKGIPDMAALWVAGLGVVAAVLATLSLMTRKNSRHPLLLVGLIAFGILILSWRIMPRMAGERALTVSQAFAIVESTPMGVAAPAVLAGSGIYLGLFASAVIALFGLTIVIKRASKPYVVSEPDDDL